MTRARQLNGRQLTTMVVAICLAVIAFPFGVSAATGNLVNITDPGNQSHKAHVDAAGRLYVADGGGSLTVNGTVNGRPVAPAGAWSQIASFSNSNEATLVGPTTSAIDLTSISVSVGFATDATSITAEIIGRRVSSTATDCFSPTNSRVLWTGYVSSSYSTSASFPTPLRWTVPAGSKGCVNVASGPINNGGDLIVNASGYLG